MSVPTSPKMVELMIMFMGNPGASHWQLVTLPLRLTMLILMSISRRTTLPSHDLILQYLTACLWYKIKFKRILPDDRSLRPQASSDKTYRLTRVQACHTETPLA